MQEKHVVTAFLRHGGNILIFRRSDKVASYQDKWAGVSGYMESTPDKHVFTEINEETSLEKEDIVLVKKGQPVVAEDPKINTRWIIHSYLFDVRDKDKITIDWEHKEMRWISPDRLDEFDTVPKLKEALDAVLE